MADCARSTPGHHRPATGKAHQIDPGAAPDFEDVLAPAGVKRHQAQQVVKLFEVILIEVVEKPPRSHGMFVISRS